MLNAGMAIAFATKIYQVTVAVRVHRPIDFARVRRTSVELDCPLGQWWRYDREAERFAQRFHGNIRKQTGAP